MASRELKEKSKQMFTEMEQGLKKMHPPKEDSMFYYHPSSHALFWNMSQTLKGRIRQMLCLLKDIVRTMVPIKVLPSCKKLAELSGEDIVSKAKDLVKNDFVKAAVGAYLLGSKVNDVVKIEDVKGYYSERLAQLEGEIKTKGRGISPMEQFLLDKFNAEIGYCNIALFKAGIGAAEELKGLVEIGKKHIEKYEREYRGNGRTVEMYL